jgi:hypothetical protein
MSQHLATIQWKRHQAKFTDYQYSREHTWQFDGGLEVCASASPHNVREPYLRSCTSRNTRPAINCGLIAKVR